MRKHCRVNVKNHGARFAPNNMVSKIMFPGGTESTGPRRLHKPLNLNPPPDMTTEHPYRVGQPAVNHPSSLGQRAWTVRNSTERYGTVRNGTEQYGTVRNSTERYGNANIPGKGREFRTTPIPPRKPTAGLECCRGWTRGIHRRRTDNAHKCTNTKRSPIHISTKDAINGWNLN